MHEPLTSGLPSGGGKSGIESLCVKTPPDSKPPDISCNPKEQTTVQKLTNRQTTKKPTAQNGTFGFCRHTSQRSKNQKSHFFANALTPFRPKTLS
jgi:hypothetical protein